MSPIQFQKAVKTQEKARIAFDGPAGGGKTWTALTIGCWMAEKENGRCVVIDSERSSALKYATDFDFDHASLPDSSPHTYIDAIKGAAAAGYKVIIVDSLSHAWEGTLEMKDRVTARSASKNSFDAWREVTPVHNELIDTMLRVPCHVIATMRTKTEYVIETNERGKNVPRKVGLAPVQRGGVEYEFDIVGDMDYENTFVVTKSRCSALANTVVRKPGIELAQKIYDWLNDGVEVASREQLAELANVIRSAPDREAVSEAWKVKYGQASRLPSAQFPEALAYAHLLTGNTTVSASGTPEPQQFAPEANSDAPAIPEVEAQLPPDAEPPDPHGEPTPYQRETLNAIIGSAGSPDQAHVVREDLKEAFGLPSQYTYGQMEAIISRAKALAAGIANLNAMADPLPSDPEGSGQPKSREENTDERPPQHIVVDDVNEGEPLIDRLNALGTPALKDFIAWRQRTKKNAPETAEELTEVEAIITKHKEKGAA